MPETPGLSEVKRVLLEKYLRGEIEQESTPGITPSPQERPQSVVFDTRSTLIPIQVAGSRRPFFFLHGDWRNGAYWCFPLAQDLGPDQPFYALEYYRFDGLPASLEAIAAAHIQSIRTIQPEGPYALGGFCNGGLLAYEMARQLHKEGQKIDPLILMDPLGPIYSARYKITCAVIGSLGKVMRLSQEKQLYLYILLRHINEYIKFAHYRNSRATWPWNVGEQVEFKDEGNSVWSKLKALLPPANAVREDYPSIYDWMAVRYHPSDLYPDKIIFFWDSEEPYRRVGWRKMYETNEFEIHIIPGTQMGCRTEYLSILTEHLRICLKRAQMTS